MGEDGGLVGWVSMHGGIGGWVKMVVHYRWMGEDGGIDCWDVWLFR